VWSDPGELRARLEAELARILDVLDARSDIEQVHSFGSLVDGDVHATSDLDLLVVQRTERDPIDRSVDLRTRLAPRVALDLFVVTPDEFAAGGRLIDHVRARGRRLR
jgi:predicted nucleotidyltransferase